MQLYFARSRRKCSTLQWRHNERDGVSNHQPRDSLFNRLFRHRSKKTSKLRVTGLCGGNSPMTDEFPAQKVSNAANVSISWRHHQYHNDVMIWKRFPSYWPFVCVASQMACNMVPWFWLAFILCTKNVASYLRRTGAHLTSPMASCQQKLTHINNIYRCIRSGAAADRRTPLKPGAQLDLASPYAVPRTRRTESPTSLNYAKLCVELNYTGVAIGEKWGDLVIRHIVLE